MTVWYSVWDEMVADYEDGHIVRRFLWSPRPGPPRPLHPAPCHNPPIIGCDGCILYAKGWPTP